MNKSIVTENSSRFRFFPTQATVWPMLIILAVGLFSCQVAEGAHPKEKIVVGYIMARGRVLRPEAIAAGKLTRINYAFARIQDGLIIEGGVHDAENFAVLNSLKRQFPALQVVVSVGGGGKGSAPFSDMAFTREGRKKFIESCVAFLEKYNLDGVDIDWEYPGVPGHQNNKFRAEDKQTYTLLLKELRLRLNREQKKLHRHLVTSTATGWTTSWIEHTDMRQASKWVDTVNLMCYDYYEPYDKTTGHDAPLFTNPADPKGVSTDRSVKENLAAGVPARKLVVGVPFYGKQWESVPPQNHGLFQPAKPAANPTPLYGVIAANMIGHGFMRYWDPIAQAPYLYNETTGTFVTYDDPEALAKKTAYVMKHHLGGIMFWEYTGDPNNVLLDAINIGLRRKVVGTK
jgi:chitinase